MSPTPISRRPALTRCATLILVFAGLLSLGAAPRHPRRAAPARQSWLGRLCTEMPELGLDAGENSCGPNLDDLTPEGLRRSADLLDSILRANPGATPDAALIRARLTRERMARIEFSAPERRPGVFVTPMSLIQPFCVPDVTRDQQFLWVAARMQKSAVRIGRTIRKPSVTPPYMAEGGAADLFQFTQLVVQIEKRSRTEQISPEAQDALETSVQKLRVMIALFSDHMKDLQATAAGDPRPDPETYRKLLAEGYGFHEPLDSLEARLRREIQETRRDLDSAATRLSRRDAPMALVEILKGSHATSEELVPSAGSTIRNQEQWVRQRWPGLPVENLDVADMGLCDQLQHSAYAFSEPRPMKAAVDRPAFTLMRPDPADPSEVQEPFLGQNNYYADSVAASRYSAPGEAMLWAMHRKDPETRLWAAGAGTFQAWGYFAQRVCARAGAVRSYESRIFEDWSRLAILGRGLVDVRLGLRKVEPQQASVELSDVTGIPEEQCRGVVKGMLDYPGRRSSTALRIIHFEDLWRALRARGVTEEAALKRLAETALYLPADQVRMLAP